MMRPIFVFCNKLCCIMSNIYDYCGLGIGEFNRKVNATSVIVNITHDAAKLVAENKDWPRSNLTADKGKLELVPLLYEFHSQMMHHYARFIAKTFFPELFTSA